jgi:phosphonate transport system substrate-binding protein
MAYFREHDVKNIDTYFKEYYFTGSHDAAIYAVLNKEADIGCAKNTTFDLLARDDQRLNEDLVVLAKSPEVPSNGLGLKKDITPAVKNQLKRVLLNMDKDPEGKEVLNKFGVIKFIETTQEDYYPVFDLVKNAGIDLKNYKYFNE